MDGLKLTNSVYTKHYRMEQLLSFAVFGLDIKITKDNQVKLTEVNGLDSGMEGFKQAKVKYLGFSCAGPMINRKSENPCEDTLKSHLSGMGIPPLNYIAKKLRNAERSDYRLTSPESIIYFEDGLRKKFDRIAEKLIYIEQMLENKKYADGFFSSLRDVKPQTYTYLPEDYSKLIKKYNPRYVVTKPAVGECGEFVDVINPRDCSNKPEFNEAMVAEPFIESKPILSLKDGQFHDGCMRYMVISELTVRGQINIHHFGGYWRLCPNPLTSNLDIEAMVANLSRGAIPEKASFEDLMLVRKKVNYFVPIFHRNLLNGYKEISERD